MVLNETNFRVNACAEVVWVVLEFKDQSLNSHNSILFERKNVNFNLIWSTYQSKIQWINFQIRVYTRSKFYRETSLDLKIVVEKPRKKKNAGNGNKQQKVSETIL